MVNETWDPSQGGRIPIYGRRQTNQPPRGPFATPTVAQPPRLVGERPLNRLSDLFAQYSTLGDGRRRPAAQPPPIQTTFPSNRGYGLHPSPETLNDYALLARGELPAQRVRTIADIRRWYGLRTPSTGSVSTSSSGSLHTANSGSLGSLPDLTGNEIARARAEQSSMQANSLALNDRIREASNYASNRASNREDFVTMDDFNRQSDEYRLAREGINPSFRDRLFVALQPLHQRPTPNYSTTPPGSPPPRRNASISSPAPSYRSNSSSSGSSGHYQSERSSAPSYTDLFRFNASPTSAGIAGFGDTALRSPSNDTEMRTRSIGTPVDIEMEGLTPSPEARPPNLNYEDPQGLGTVGRVAQNTLTNIDLEMTRRLGGRGRGGDPFRPPVEVGSHHERLAGKLLGALGIAAATTGSSLLVNHLKGRYVKNKKEKEEEEKRKKKEKQDALDAAVQAEKDRLKAEVAALKEAARLEKIAIKEAKARENEKRKEAEMKRREELYARKIQAEIEAAKAMAARVPLTRQQIEEQEHIRQTNQANKPRPVRRPKSRKVG